MSILRARTALLTLALGLLGCADTATVTTKQPSGNPSGQQVGAGVQRLRQEAIATRPLVRSLWAAEFLEAASQLSGIPPRRVGNESVDELGYYYGGIESPAFFARLLDLLGEGDVRHLAGRRMLDLHYESIGPLRMLAATGVDAVGVNPSPRLRTLYGFPGDQGEVHLLGRDAVGRVTLLSGQFGAEPATRTAVGGGYDAVIVKNLLKRGYVHPAEATAAETQVQLGLPDAEYLSALLALLRPGGRLLVYNLCPAPAGAGQPYNPHTDCRNPFPQAQWQGAGFRVLDYERSDTASAREFLQALGLNNELYATYTLLERL